MTMPQGIPLTTAAARLPEESLPAAGARQRSAWVDVAKGLGMVLVVFGHVLGGLIASGRLTGGAPQRVYDWMYAFHMPAFMVLSALFLEAACAKRSLRAFALERVKRLYYPAVVWGLATWVLSLVFASATNRRPDPWEPLRVLVDPTGPVWFLRCLLLLSLAYCVLRIARLGAWGMLAIGAVGAGVCIRLGWSLDSRTLTLSWYGAWVALGVLVSRPVMALGVRGHVALLAALTVLGGVGTVALMPAPTPGEVYPAPLAAPFGVVLLCGGAMVLSRLGSLARPLALVGRRSLEVFVVSGLASVGTRMVLLRLAPAIDPCVLGALCTIAGVVLPVALAEACQRAGIGYVFHFGPAASRRTPSVSAPPA